MNGSVAEPRPGRRDPAGRRRAILRAAAEIIVEQGAASLTHRAVAARAGVALASTTQYFSSIDELRELALQLLADEVDEGIAEVEELLLPLEDAPERCAAMMYEFLLDDRQVRASVAIVSAALSDPDLAALARRWTDRLGEILARHVGRHRALAISLYLDGATMHAALHDEPVDRESLAHTIRALLDMPENPKDA